MTCSLATLSPAVCRLVLVVTQSGLHQVARHGVLTPGRHLLSAPAPTGNAALGRLSHPPHKPAMVFSVLSTLYPLLSTLFSLLSTLYPELTGQSKWDQAVVTLSMR